MITLNGAKALEHKNGHYNQPSRPFRIALIPAYNEARFIGSVVIEARQHVSSVIVVDDGSSDTTARIAREAGAEVLELGQNVGKAQAVSLGIRHIRTLKPTAVVMLDGDGQHDANQIPHLLAPIEAGEADVVIGSRFMGIQSLIPKWRLMGQHALTAATNWTSGVKTSDSQSGFRAFSSEVLPFLDFTQKGFSLESEIQFIARKYNLSLAEVPIEVVYEEPAKRNPVTHGLEVLHGIMRLVGQHRPLLFFGLPSVTMLLIGVLMGIWVMEIYQATYKLAVGYALICLLAVILGSVGLSTGVILHSLRAWLLGWVSSKSGEEKSLVV